MEELKVIENELVPVYETSAGEKVVYGTELHEILEVKSNYRDWIRNRLNDCDAVKDDDYEAAKILAPSGQSMNQHIIKLDTAKEMAMLERNEKGKQVRRYFIQIEKKYKSAAIDIHNLDPQTQLMNLLVQSISKNELEQKRQAVELEKVKQIVDKIEAKTTTRNEDYFTIAGYASLRGLNVDISKAGMLGRKAAKLSKEYGYDIDKVKDMRFGTVNAYHTDILKQVFEDVA